MSDFDCFIVAGIDWPLPVQVVLVGLILALVCMIGRLAQSHRPRVYLTGVVVLLSCVEVGSSVGADVPANNPKVKTLLHGFNLSPYRSSETWEALSKSEAIFNREKKLEEGGAWRCWVDSAERYSRWCVYFQPVELKFYVRDTWNNNVAYGSIQGDSNVVYGPIQGDAIEKLRLLDGSSDLVAAKADRQNLARASGQFRSRVSSLLESTNPLLRAHGLRVVSKLGDLKIHEWSNWNERIQKIGASDLDRDLKTLLDSATSYLADQHRRIEAMRVKLDDDEYSRGREPTKEELEAGWGPASDGLSLAIDDWTRDVRLADDGDSIFVWLLVRNVSDKPKRISTLDVLDGVRIVATDLNSQQSVRIDFGTLSGIPMVERYLLEPGQLVAIKNFSIQVKQGDMLPKGKKYNPRSLEVLYGHIKLQPKQAVRLDFTLSMPSAYMGEAKGKITLPAHGEFHGALTAKPVYLGLR